MPSASDAAEIRTAQATLAGRAQADLAGFWRSLDLGAPERSRDALVEFVPAVTTAYGRASAALMADWYDGLRATEGVPGRFTASLAEPFPVEYVEQRVRFGASHLFTENPGAMLAFLVGAVQEYALRPGRETVARSSIEDPQAAGWHRETRGDGCSFCRMLAGRGGVYRKATAGFASHGGCNCVAMPSWDRDAPEVPVSAYVASERTSRMSDSQKERHRERVRDFLAAGD